MPKEEEDLQNALVQLGFAPCPFRGEESAAGQLAKAELALREAEDEIEADKTRAHETGRATGGHMVRGGHAGGGGPKAARDGQAGVFRKDGGGGGLCAGGRGRAALDRLCRRFPLAYELSDAGEDAPVLLKNNRFVRPVESITKMYALPGPKDIDPSGVMAFFYYVFFGMMLSDAGYGLVMVLGTTWALRRLPLKREMAETLRMFRYCGVSTVCWGALFGSWFGDIVQVVGRSFFSVEIGSLALWFEPMTDPIRLLLFSFALGLVHLCAGLFVRAGMLIKQHRAWDAVLDTLPVLLLVLGAAPLAAGIFIPVPETLAGAGKGMAAIGAVLLVFTSGRSGKRALAKLGGGLYGLYNTASGYLSDVLSYSRLLALGLATGSIAGVVNLMGAMPANPAVRRWCWRWCSAWGMR
ncbi:MAG: V-type ATP synthase subunit I [Christensenellales bacterium]